MPAEIELQTSDQLRKVEHITSYKYAHAVENTYHVAVMEPRPMGSEQGRWVNEQKISQFSLEVSPTPSHLKTREDSFGNLINEFELRKMHQGLEVKAVSQLKILSAAKEDATLFAKTAPWEAVAQSVTYQKNRPFKKESEFTFPSARISKSEALHSLALLEFWPHRPVAQAAFALMQRIHKDFTYQSGSTGVDTSIEEVLKTKKGVCQDFAHILIGALRGVGLPARYVSGYMLTEPPPGKPKLIGADASHAWCSVWLGEEGWMDLDPTNNKIPDARYVTVAIGRDYEDVPPLKGLLHGGGQHRLSVAVTVS